jgi:hypothetical protein
MQRRNKEDCDLEPYEVVGVRTVRRTIMASSLAEAIEFAAQTDTDVDKEFHDTNSIYVDKGAI